MPPRAIKPVEKKPESPPSQDSPALPVKAPTHFKARGKITPVACTACQKRKRKVRNPRRLFDVHQKTECLLMLLSCGSATALAQCARRVRPATKSRSVRIPTTASRRDRAPSEPEMQSWSWKFAVYEIYLRSPDRWKRSPSNGRNSCTKVSRKSRVSEASWQHSHREVPYQPSTRALKKMYKTYSSQLKIKRLQNHPHQDIIRSGRTGSQTTWSLTH